MAYITADAPTKHELSSCVQCGLCLPHCPTFRLTGRESASPRGRLAAMKGVLDGVTAIDEVFDEAMSFCLQCRACEAVCPGLVPYGRLMEGARAELVKQRPTMRRRITRFGLGTVLPSRPLIAIATWGAAAAQRLPGRSVFPAVARRALDGFRRLDPLRPSWRGRDVEPAGTSRGTVALLVGCVMGDWFGPVHDATVDLIVRAGYRVVVPNSQTCCGALGAHDGLADVTRKLAAQNVAAFRDVDVLVSDSAGCTAHVKDYGHWTEGGDDLAAKTRDVTEFVAGLIADGLLPELPSNGQSVAMQDPCHLRHAQRILAEPRAMIRAAGYRPVEIDPDGLCCGAAGIYSVLRPDTSGELGETKARQINRSGATLVSSANPGCEMQLRAHLGEGYQVKHPVEIYYEALLTSGVEYPPAGS